MNTRLLAISCLLIYSVGVVSAQRASKQRSTPERDVKQTVERFSKAWATNNVDEMRRVCLDKTMLIESGRQLSGLQVVLDYMQFNFKNFPRMEIEMGPVEARVTRTTAWAHAETKQTLVTEHGLTLKLAGHSFYILERQRSGWRIVLINLDLKQVPAATSETPTPASRTLQGAWMLEASKDLTTGQNRTEAATIIFTKTRVCYLAAATDRRQPKDKRFSDYSRKELQEILRGVESGAGMYRLEGDNIILTLGHTLLPHHTGREVTWENVIATPDQLSFEVVTPEGRLQRVWRRIE